MHIICIALWKKHIWVSIIIRVPYLIIHHKFLLKFQDLFSIMFNILKIKTLTFFVLRIELLKEDLWHQWLIIFTYKTKTFEISL